MKSSKSIRRHQVVLSNLQKSLSSSIDKANSESFIFEGSIHQCLLSKEKVKSITPILLGALHSTETILRMSKLSGFAVRDIYPILRSVLESLINASYIIVSDDCVAQKALRYALYADWRDGNREVGSGEQKLKIQSFPEVNDDEFKSIIAEFKSARSWTRLDVPNRIRAIEESGFKVSSKNLLATYFLIYSVSSDIIHGSPYGFRYFVTAHLNLKEKPTYDAFLKATEKQIDWIFLSLIMAIGSYLSIFSKINKLGNVDEMIDTLVEESMNHQIEISSS